MDRRRFLKTGIAASTPLIAGCSEAFDTDVHPETTDRSTTTDSTETTTQTSTSTPEPMSEPLQPDGFQFFQYNPGHTGYIRSANPPTDGVEQLWKKQIYQEKPPSITVLNGTAYIAAGEGLNAVDVGSGEILWENDLGIHGQALVHDNLVYQLAGGNIHAFSIHTGVKQWEKEYEYSHGGPEDFPVIQNGKIYQAVQDRIVEINPENGESTTALKVDNGVAYPATITNGLACFMEGTEDDCWFAVYDLETGENLWHTDSTHYGMEGARTVADNRAYLTWEGDGVTVYNVYTGEVIWKNEEIGHTDGSVAVTDDTVYFGNTRGNKFYSLDKEDGSVQWSFETNEGDWRSPVVAGDTILAVSYDTLYAFDTESNKLWSYQAESEVNTSPAIANGVVYIADEDYAYALGPA